MSLPDVNNFVSFSPFKTPNGILSVLKDNKTVQAMAVPAGFQLDRWVTAAYGDRIVTGSLKMEAKAYVYTIEESTDPSSTPDKLSLEYTLLSVKQ